MKQSQINSQARDLVARSVELFNDGKVDKLAALRKEAGAVAQDKPQPLTLTEARYAVANPMKPEPHCEKTKRKAKEQREAAENGTTHDPKKRKTTSSKKKAKPPATASEK